MNDGVQVSPRRENAARYACLFVGLCVAACGGAVGNGSDAGEILLQTDSSTADQSIGRAPSPDAANDNGAASDGDGDGASSDSGSCGFCYSIDASDGAALCALPHAGACPSTLAEAMATLCGSTYSSTGYKWKRPCQGIMLVGISTTVDEGRWWLFDVITGDLEAVGFGGAGYNALNCTAVPGFTLPCQCFGDGTVNDYAARYDDLCPDASARAGTITDASREATD